MKCVKTRKTYYLKVYNLSNKGMATQYKIQYNK